MKRKPVDVILNEIEDALQQDIFVQKYRTHAMIMEELEAIFDGRMGRRG